MKVYILFKLKLSSLDMHSAD